MNKRVFTIMIALLLAAFVPKAYGQGAGTEEVPIEISSYGELKKINFNGHYKLMADITVDSNWDCTGIFAGTFDGNGHVISGLSVSKTTGNAGLFATIDANGIVKNLGVTGTSETTDNAHAGGIAGNNNGTIQNCYTSVAVTANGSNDYCAAGGIAGNNSGTIQDCYTTGAATCKEGKAGGIAGTNTQKIQNCYATGAIKGYRAGGITGYTSSTGTIQNCIALNDGINGSINSKGEAPKIGRITGYKAEPNSTTANHAALSIPGVWTGKGAGTENGDDLTEDTFIGNTADAFSSWSMDNWSLYTPTPPHPEWLQG